MSQHSLSQRAQLFAGVFGHREHAQAAARRTLGATTIANDRDLEDARVGFQAAFLLELAAKEDPIGLLALEVQSRNRSEQHHFLGDLPGFEEWTSDRKLSGVDAYSLQRLVNRDWSNGLRIKNNDFKDDALGLLPAHVAGLATKARRHRWDMLAELLLNGFDGTAYPDIGNGLSYDDAFFFSDSHETGDNKMAAAFDAAGLAAAELLLTSQTTFDGDPLEVRGTHIICGPKLEPAVRKLLAQEFLTGGESNANRARYEMIVSNRIRGTYDDYWFLADLSHAFKPLMLQMREEISTSATGSNGQPAFQANELWFGAEARYNVGYFEHRLIVGSAV